jgi:hemerythrin-like domain-containing protein
MSNPIARWREEHVRFAKLLDTLEAQLDCFHRAERPDYPLMLEVMRYMRHYPDTSHHPREDLAFEKVAQRDPRARAMFAQLVQEHRDIDHAGATLVELLEGVLDDAILSREAVEEPGREYIRRLRAHMDSEEVLFPFVQTWLEPRDWAEIDGKIPPSADPLLSPHGSETYTALHRVLKTRTSGKRIPA